MKNEKLFDGITDIREDLIEGAEKYQFKKSQKTRWLSAVAAVLVVALIAGVAFFPIGDFEATTPLSSTDKTDPPITSNTPVEIDTDLSPFAISEAIYPKMTQFPMESDFETYETYANSYSSWQTDRKALRNQPLGYDDSYKFFFEKSFRQFLSDDGNENKIYSPLNIYMALAMLAETTGGNSRQQILELLGTDSIETLRSQANSLWKANYSDDGLATSILASSVWLSDRLEFVDSTLESLSEHYYASSFSGEMGSDEYNKALQGWLNEQTGGLLKEQIGDIELDVDTIMALATTVYFNARWSGEFSPSVTAKDAFHAESGDITCDFMHQSNTQKYYRSENFGAVSKPLLNSGKMWFILPDEGIDLEDIINSSETSEFILADGKWENAKSLKVNLSVPKFDVDSQSELTDDLYALGITDVFDDTKSDFSPMVKSPKDIIVSSVQHGARVKIDEEGCEAAAYTMITADTTSMNINEEEIDFVLDRPFIFVITSDTGAPLFVGAVNQPA